MRWTTGILADCDTLPDAPSTAEGISFRNRGIMGSGHGWTTAWSVAWNVITPYFLVSNASGTINWAIGGKGTKKSISGDSDGIYDHFNTIVEPKSLYLQQLLERLGAQALVNIGYGSMAGVNQPLTLSRTATALAFRVSGSALYYTLDHAAGVEVRMYSANGEMLGEIHAKGNPGKNRTDLSAVSAGGIPAGMYIVNVKTGNSEQTFRYFR